MKTNTKYIKVSVSERLPEKEGDYYVKMRHISDLQLYYYLDPLHDRDYMNKHVEYWLKEVPDYDDEILAMLERMKINIVFTSVRGFDKPLTLEEVDNFSKDVDDLIEKIKHGKVL